MFAPHRERASLVKLPRLAASTLVAVALAVSMSLGVVLPAQAASAVGGWNPKQYMINVLSSMLSAAGGDNPYKRAVIAADQTFDHSWEAFEEQWKSSRISPGTPGSYNDYVLQKQEYFLKNNIKSTQGDTVQGVTDNRKYVGKAGMPATKRVKLMKATKAVGGVVGALAPVLAFEYRAEISSGVAGMFGVDDTTGAVCANSQFLKDNGVAAVWTGFQNWVTGVDCDAWAYAQAFQPNADAAEGWNGASVCQSGGACMRLDGRSLWDHASNRAAGYCLASSGTWVVGQNALSTRLVYPAGTALPAGQNLNQTFTPRTVPDTFGWLSGTECGGSTMWARMFNADSAWIAAHPAPPAPIRLELYNPSTSVVVASGAVTTTSADPDRHFECDIKGSNGVTYTASSESFKETDADGAAAIVCPTFPEDVKPLETEIREVGGGQDTKILDEPTTDAFRSFWDAYPECREGACALDLERKADGVSCFTDAITAATCAAWMMDPLKSTNYQCTYGIHDVALEECYAYGETFKPESIATGRAYADPLTGLPVTGQSSPNAATGALNRLAVDPRDFNGCLDKGWAEANPVEWVVVPVTCSMQASFVPRTGFVDGEMAKVAVSWSNTGPAALAASVANWHIAPTVSGCETSIPFPVPLIGRSITVPIIQACPGTPFGDFAPFIRFTVSATLIVTAGFACKKIVGGWLS